MVRRFRFSLRLMLVVVTVACIALAVWVVPIERQRRAVQAIRDAGGGLSYAWRDPEESEKDLRWWLPQNYIDEVDVVRLSDTEVTDDTLAHLGALARLQCLVLDGSGITDAGLVHLEALSNLQQLVLDGTKITDAGLVHLQRLTGLRTLALHDTQITRDGLGRLRTALPNCEVFSDLSP